MEPQTVGHASRCRHRGRDHMPVGKYGRRLGRYRADSCRYGHAFGRRRNQTPAVQSFIPQIAPEVWLLRVNAINGTLQTAISIASPAIVSALVNLMPLWMIMLVDVSTAIVGIGFVALIHLDDARLRRPGRARMTPLRATSISVSSCSPIPLTDLPRPRTRSCKRRATCPCRGEYWVC